MTATSKLALFDFDGTITNRDTLLEFTRFTLGMRRYFAGLAYMSPVLVLERGGLVASQKAKEMFLSHFFGGMHVREFENCCQDFCKKHLPSLIRPAAAEAIESYRKEGTPIYIVSASPEDWIEPWAATLGIKVIATKLSVYANTITGSIAGYNCNGEEKVNRIKEVIDLSKYTHIAAYGDSKGDTAMLGIATEKHFKPFR